MNTSGISFKDHADSMDLCQSAVEFAQQTLKPGGHLVCKFYQGSEDKALENELRSLFEKVHREKPNSSRKVWFYSTFCDLKSNVDLAGTTRYLTI